MLIGSTFALTLAALITSPVFAQVTGGTSVTANTPVVMASSSPKKATVDLACVQTAVDTREDAIGSAFTTFSTAESAALAARKSALHDAWGITSSKDRRVAREKAWTDFRTANRAAFSALRTARKSAWAAFATASKACHTPVVESASSEGTGSLGL